MSPVIAARALRRLRQVNDGGKSILTERRRKAVASGICARRRWAVRAVFALLSVLAFGFARSATAAPLLTDTSITKQSGLATQITLNLTEPVEYQVFTLADPYRVVIDLPRTARAVQTPPPQLPQGLVEQLRYGRPNGDDTRIVLDCAGAARVGESYLMKPGNAPDYRLVVNVSPLTSEAGASAGSDAAPPREPKPFLQSVLAVLPPPPPAARPQPVDLPVTKPAAKASVGGIAVLAPPRRPSSPDARRDGNAPTRHVVVIDPGHGGKDPGAISSNGDYEKSITLSAARELRAALLRRGGYKVVLTRDRDVFIPLRERVALARRAGADVFVSLHANITADPSVRGFSAYTLSERSSDAQAQALAESENKADLISGISFPDKSPEVAEILVTLAQRDTMNHSFRLARSIVGSVQGTAAVLPRTHRFAGFAVLKAPDVPSILIELGFLSNAADEKLLNTPAHRRKVAEAITEGIDRYFDPTQTVANLQ